MHPPGKLRACAEPRRAAARRGGAPLLRGGNIVRVRAFVYPSIRTSYKVEVRTMSWDRNRPGTKIQGISHIFKE